MTTPASAPIPWGVWLRMASQLGVAPAQFWALSVREWVLLTAHDATPSLGRSGLAALMTSFPDIHP